MANKKSPNLQSSKFKKQNTIENWVKAFLMDRRAQNLSPNTIEFYRDKLTIFIRYMAEQEIIEVEMLTATHLREFLMHLEETGHNPGGIHAIYRSMKAFLRWFELEAEPDGWKNPIGRVKAPKVPVEPLDPVELVDVAAMVKTCVKNTFLGARDRAILLALLDTGARAQEFLNVDMDDINIITGEVYIRQGKGRKPRMVYLGEKSRKAVRAYLKLRRDDIDALWITDDRQGRLTYNGLRSVLDRRAQDAGLATIPSAHDFRRAFAINMLRSGVDLATIAKLLGHTSLAVLQRYLKITNTDTQRSHRGASPSDKL